MDNKGICRDHNAGSDGEKWQVMLEELVESGDFDFEGQVCPCCFSELLHKLKKMKRALKVESKQAVRLRRENSEMKDVLDAVMGVVFQMTGKDPQKLAEKEYEASSAQPGPKPVEHGELKNILPNLIVEAVSKGGK